VNGVAPALVQIATVDAKVKANFTRVVIIPNPTDTFRVETKNFTVTFSGNNPPEVLSLGAMDFLFFNDAQGNATLGRCVRSIKTARAISWEFTPSDLSDIFEHLDMSADVARITDYSGVDQDKLSPTAAAQLALEMVNLDVNLKRQLCLMIYSDDDPRMVVECMQAMNGRRRSLYISSGDIAGFYGNLKKSVIGSIEEYERWKSGTSIDKALVLFDRGYAHTSKCQISGDGKWASGVRAEGDIKLEVGIKAGATSRLQFKLEIGLFLFRARLDAHGELTVAAYL
jgi:hypothetical protein